LLRLRKLRRLRWRLSSPVDEMLVFNLKVIESQAEEWLETMPRPESMDGEGIAACDK
jgi:hypothetical protein